MAKASQQIVSQSLSSKTNTTSDFNYLDQLEAYFNQTEGTYAEKIAAFPKYVPRQRLTDFLSLYEIFKRVISVQGSVIDCGVYRGRTLMTFAQLSAILEPMNYQRQIVGFDTFRGFLSLSDEDSLGTHDQTKTGGFKADSYNELLECIRLYDANRFLNHMPKVILIKGDIVETAPAFLQKNPHTVVSLLSLDLSLYEPTKAALKAFLPRMPKGAVITFSEMNCSDFSGEVPAVIEELGIRNLRIERNPFDTVASFAVLE